MAAWTERAAVAPFAVMAENWPALRLFVRCATQWRLAGMGGVLGLDYGAVAWVAQVTGASVDEDLLDRLQVLEHAAAAALNAK